MEYFKLHTGSIINGEVRKGDGRKVHEVRFPYNKELVGKVDFATEQDVLDAINGAYITFHEEMSKLPAYKRSKILRNAASIMETRKKELAEILTLEVGKTIKDALGEVNRAIQVLEFSSEEAKKIHGETIPMDAAIGGENRFGMIKKYPIGVVVAITPFNFPLNLALHKIGPAIAAGNTTILKPAEKTPLSSVYLYEILVEAGLPPSALQIVMGEGPKVVPLLVKDEKVSKVSFTGSYAVGKLIHEMAGLKKVTLELGSNSPNIVLNDANVEEAAKALVRGSFVNAGQVCISVQRIYVQKDILNEFENCFIEYTKKLKVGNPLDECTDVAGMITDEACNRAKEWIDEAVNEGAEILIGGEIIDGLLQPTVLTNVKSSMKVVCNEIFAPVVSIIPFETDEEALELANDSEYGLQASVFTSNLHRAIYFADKLQSGGVWINEMSTYRQDNYPYGGIKKSGIGKEGVAYAIEDMLMSKFIGIKY